MKKALLIIGLFLLPAMVFSQIAHLTPEMVNPDLRYNHLTQNYIVPEGKFEVNLPDKPLSNDKVRYLVINNLATTSEMNFGQDFYYATIAKLARYKDYTVGAPFSDATFNTYKMENLEALIIPLGDLPLNLATQGGVSLIGYMEEMINAGKKVYIIGNRVLYHAFDSRASANTRVQFAQEFIQERLGADFFTVPGRPDFVSWTDGGTTTWVAFYMRGAEDPPFGSITIYCNWEKVNLPDNVVIYPLSKALITHLGIFKLRQGPYKPLTHWTGLSSSHYRTDTLTGSRGEFGDSRIAFVGLGIEHFCGESYRQYMLEFTLNWLMENVAEDGPQISFQSESVDFGIVKIGESVNVELPITNIGNQPLIITEAFIEANSDDDEFEALSGEIKKGQQVSLNFQDTHRLALRYTPVKDGESTGWIKVSSNSVNSPGKLIWLKGLGGTGSGPRIEFNYPERVMDFGTVWSTNRDLTLRIQNVGDVEMKIDELKINVNDDAAFGFPQQINVPLYIKPGKEFPLNIRFALRPEPRDYRGNLIIKSDAILGNSEVNIELKARVGGSGPYIKTSSTKLDFGVVHTETGDEKTITIENTGKQALVFNSIAVQGDYEGAFSITAGSDINQIEVNESADIKIKFKPGIEKDYSANLLISSNAENDPTRSIELIGKGSLTSVWEDPSSSSISYMKITPNPVTETGLIEIKMQKEQNVELLLTDINGKVIKTLLDQTFINKDYNLSFNTNDLPSGTYFIVARSGSTVAAIKTVIAK